MSAFTWIWGCSTAIGDPWQRLADLFLLRPRGARRAVGSTVGAAARPGQSVFQTAVGSSRVLRRGSAVRCWV